VLVIVFRSRLRPSADGEAYGRRVSEILEHAQRMAGFISIKDFAADDGERVAIVEWASAPELEDWAAHAEHVLAQQQGRDEFYAEYSLQICDEVRSSTWHLPSESR